MNSRRIIEEDLCAILARELPWQNLSGCNVVVTGAAGFIGGYIVRVLLTLNDKKILDFPVKVKVAVRDIEKAKLAFADVNDISQLMFMACDLNQISVPDLGDINYIFHAASLASPKYYGIDPLGTILPNVVGTAALLDAFRKSSNPCGFLFVSSSEVYGEVTGEIDLSEERYGIVDPATVRACYAESKRLGETLCVATEHQYKLPTYIVRPFHTYGPGLKSDDGRVFADFVFNIIRNENIVMNSSGLARRAFCYVSDAIAGLFTVLLLGEKALPYNVANPAGDLSIKELAQLLIDLYPDKRLRIERRIQHESNVYLASPLCRLMPNVDRLIKLGWSPMVSPEIGFHRMIEAYQR